MKTSEVIRRLQEADPTGECEVCVGNVDIHFIERIEAYYDGPLQVLIRDGGRPGYNIVGAKFKREGSKVQVHLLPIMTALTEDPEMPVDYGELAPQCAAGIQARHNKWREEVRKLRLNLSRERFVRWFFKELKEKEWEALDPEYGDAFHDYVDMAFEQRYKGEYDIEAHYELVLGDDGNVEVQRRGIQNGR